MGKKRKVTVKWFARRANRIARMKRRRDLRILPTEKLDEKGADKPRNRERYEWY